MKRQIIILGCLIALFATAAHASEPTLEVDVTVEQCPPGDPAPVTICTATVNLMYLTPDLRRYNLQVWSGGSLVIEMPAAEKASGIVDVTGVHRPRFKLVDTETGEAWLMIRPEPFKRVPCVTNVPGGRAIWLRVTEWSHEVPVPRRVRR